MRILHTILLPDFSFLPVYRVVARFCTKCRFLSAVSFRSMPTKSEGPPVSLCKILLFKLKILWYINSFCFITKIDVQIKKMTIELGKFFPRKTLLAPVQLPDPDPFSGHKRLFDHYGISLDDLNANPENGVTMIPTPDGILYIDWGKRAIVSPLKYNPSQVRS